MFKKKYYYYIDESGHINNDQHLFLYGCLKIDTPNLSDDHIKKLKDELKDEIDFEEFEKKIEEGFHACVDHPDLQTQFYKIIPTLNFRAYFEIIYKESRYFENLKKEYSGHEIISKMLENIIKSMLFKNKKAKHIFFIEELEIQGKSLKKILKEIDFKYSVSFDFELNIENKGNDNLSITDYVNNNIFKLLKEKDEEKFKKNYTRVAYRFNLLKDKIALIHLWNNDTFFSRKGKIEETVEITNLRKILTEE